MVIFWLFWSLLFGRSCCAQLGRTRLVRGDLEGPFPRNQTKFYGEKLILSCTVFHPQRFVIYHKFFISALLVLKSPIFNTFEHCQCFRLEILFFSKIFDIISNSNLKFQCFWLRTKYKKDHLGKEIRSIISIWSTKKWKFKMAPFSWK